MTAKEILAQAGPIPGHTMEQWLRDAWLDLLEIKRLAADSDWTELVAVALGCATATYDEDDYIDEVSDYDYKEFEAAWMAFLDEMIKAVKNGDN